MLKKKHHFLCLVILSLTLHHTAIGFASSPIQELSPSYDFTAQDYTDLYQYIEIIPHDVFYADPYPYVEMIPRYEQMKDAFYNRRYFTDSGFGSAVQKRNNNPINCSYGFTAQEFPHLSAIDDPTRQDIFTTTYFTSAFYAAPYQSIEIIPRSEQLKDAFYDNREFIESHLDFTIQKRGNHSIFFSYEPTYRDFFKNHGTTERELQHPLAIGDHIPQDIVSITYYSPEFYTNGYEDIEMLFSYFLQEKESKFYRNDFVFAYYPFENKEENVNSLYASLYISPLGEIKYTNVNYDDAAPSTILAKNWYTALPPVYASAGDSLVVNNKVWAYSYKEDMEDAHLLAQELSNAYYPKVRSMFLQNRTDFQRLVDLLKQKRGSRAFAFFYDLSAGYGISRNWNDRPFYYRFFGSYEPPTNLQSRTLYFSVNPDLPQSIEKLIEGAQDIEQFIMAHHKSGVFSPIANIGQVTYKCIVNTNEENNPAYHVNFKFAQAQSILVELEYTSTDIPLHAEHASYVRLAPHWYYKLSKYRRSADFWNVL